MLNTKREKRLFRIFGIALAGMIAWQTVGQYVFHPITALQQKLRTATAEDRRLQRERETVYQVAAQLEEFQNQSLPSDPDTASVVYQHWLIRCLKSCQINDAMVTPGPAIPVEQAGHRIPFSVSGSATLSRIGALLDSIQTTRLLHRVTHLNIASHGNSTSGTRTLTMTLEVFAANGSENTARLPDALPVTDGNSLQLAFSQQDFFQRQVRDAQAAVTTVSRNEPKDTEPIPNIEPTHEVPADVEPTHEEPTPQPPESWLFAGSVLNNGIRQAWFINSSSGQDSILEANGSLHLGSSVLTVIEIHSDEAQIRLDNKQLTIAIGDVVHEPDAVTHSRSS
ncbi:MAG: hypothetical protein MK110_18455 [Fuerstiella sp.]|nr:hypothetical protein [Fuerstiella sp.]